MPISDCGSDVCSADLSGVSSHETEQSARRGNAKMRRAMRRYVMKISECMSRDVQLATPDHSLQSAAQMMADIDTGFLPVADNDRLIGIVTDRDIAIRGVAAGRRPEASIREVMSDEGKDRKSTRLKSRH